MRRSNLARLLLLICAVGAGVLVISVGAGVPIPKVKPLSAYDSQVHELLSKMTLDEKIGQMTQADQQFLRDIHDIDKYHLGSLLSGGDSDPKAGNSLEAWTDLYDRYQSVALKTRLGIPLLYGIDAVHGHNNVLGAVIFPHNIGLGCTRNRELVEKVERVTAEEVRATGINWAFAPCVTVPRDIRWGRSYEGYGEAQELPALLAGPAVQGFQGQDLSDPLSVLACAKHLAGDGGTTWGTGLRKMLDHGDTRVDEATLRRIHLQGYVSALRAGVGSIMVSYSSWNGAKCSGSKRLMTEILKQETGFEGFLISDYAALDELPGDYKAQIEQSINAGMDMVMVPERYQVFFDDLKQLVNEGRVPMSRIDDAVTRILRVKAAMGLLDKDRSPLADRKLWKTFGSAEHRQVAREAVRQSIVLLKDDHKTLPLSKQVARIHVGGKSADDLGNQCGGWTISWQGHSGNVTPGGTTILAAIRKAVSPTTKVTFSKDGTGAEGASVGVVVVGEAPYAEMMGDRTDLRLAAEDVRAIDNMKQAGIPVVVILLSGRPMIIDGALSKSDAFLAVWLPGTEGEGGRRAVRGLQAHRETLFLLATLDGAGPDPRGRPQIRPALSLRLWLDLLARLRLTLTSVLLPRSGGTWVAVGFARALPAPSTCGPCGARAAGPAPQRKARKARAVAIDQGTNLALTRPVTYASMIFMLALPEDEEFSLSRREASRARPVRDTIQLVTRHPLAGASGRPSGTASGYEQSANV